MQTFYDLLKVFIENERVLPSGSLHSVLQSRIFQSTIGAKNFSFPNSPYQNDITSSSIKQELLKSFRERGVTIDFLLCENNEQSLLKYLLIEMALNHLQSLFTSTFGNIPMSTRAKKIMSVNELSACLGFIQTSLKEILYPKSNFHNEFLKRVKTNTSDKKFSSLDLREERLVGPIIFQNLEINNGVKTGSKDDSFKRKAKVDRAKMDDLKEAVEKLKNENRFLMEEMHQMRWKENFKRPQPTNFKPFNPSPPSFPRRFEAIECEDDIMGPKSYKTPVREKKQLLELSLSAIKTKGDTDKFNISDLSSFENIISKVDFQPKPRKINTEPSVVKFEQKKLNARLLNDHSPTNWAYLFLIVSLLLYYILH